MIEMNHKGFVLVFAEHMVEKAVARCAFLAEDAPLAHARVHEESQGEGKIGFLREVLDRLRATVFIQCEVVFGEVARDFSFFVPHRGEDVHELYIYRNIGLLLALAKEGRLRNRQKAQQSNRAEPYGSSTIGMD